MVGSPNPVRYVYGEGPVREALEQALRARKLAFDEITIGGSSDHAPFDGRRDLRRRPLLGLGGTQERAPGRAPTAAAPAARSTPATTAAATRSTVSTRRSSSELADAAGRALVAIG